VGCVAGAPAIAVSNGLVLHGGVTIVQSAKAIAGNTKLFAIHHIGTNKNTKSGNQWTNKLRPMYEKAGVDIDKDSLNLVDISPHSGPHPNEYHQWVFDRLSAATRGLDGEKYAKAFRAELEVIKRIIRDNPNMVNNGPYPGR
jgi:hypothetical protein